jgi:hypothetical protein
MDKLTLLGSILPAQAHEIDWERIDAAFGREPAAVTGDIHPAFAKRHVQADGLL